MRQRDWDAAYNHLLNRAGFAGMGSATTSAEQRKHPRFSISSVTVTAKVEIATEHIINASAGGIAFSCAFSFMPGTLIQLSFEKYLTLDATVVHCRKNENESERKYSIQCKFADEGDGKQLLVMIMDMNTLGKASASI
ncbi:MAG: PilZ domain-containing protein [Candidatus Lambdaproteobacteria bacterium]|nr:PilZ domain-containing protein [Candidatus Lambdaproteobacteria bacterium]